MRRILTLSELNTLVGEKIRESMPGTYWVKAEIDELNENGGHCYMTLIEKDERSSTPSAKARACCWRSVWARVKPFFERATGQALCRGMKVLLSVSPEFHKAYGFSWIVHEIDPDYTLGDMQRRRMEIINALKERGVFSMNKELTLPLFCQRIAVISSRGAAGYGDFMRQLTDNDYGYRFRAELFDCVMQGEYTERSIIGALNKINRRLDDFDCVVIIRGGGAKSDLSGFDTLPLAENAAQFPLPVITGIGHERDETVLDLIAYTKEKTPTAAAQFLIKRLRDVDDRLNDCSARLTKETRNRLQREELRLGRLTDLIRPLFSVVKTRQQGRINELRQHLALSLRVSLNNERVLLNGYGDELRQEAKDKLTREKHRLELLSQRADALNPDVLLRRGYSITIFKGTALSDAGMVKHGDLLTTRLANGLIESTVI